MTLERTIAQIKFPVLTVVKRGLLDTYRMHQYLMELFPEVKPLIWHRDPVGPREVQLTLVAGGTLEPKTRDAMQILTKPISESFLSRPRYRFSVRLSTERQKWGDKKRSPVPDAELMSFFEGRAPKWGFAPEDVVIEQSGIDSFIRRKKGAHTGLVELKFAEYSGLLTVTDAELFRQSVLEGVGHHKAFGFGLLRVVPVE